MTGMSHDSTFPESPETSDGRTERALEALRYEERAGLGFRRRQRKAIGDPYAEPERFQVDREPTAGELWAGLLAGIGAVLGFSALFYKPLIMGTLAVMFTVLGSLGDGAPSRIAKWGMTVAGFCFFFGMVLSIFVTNKSLW